MERNNQKNFLVQSQLLALILLAVVAVFFSRLSEIKEVLILVSITIVAFVLLNQSIGKSNVKIKFIFLFSYVISFIFILWINFYSLSLGSEAQPFLPGDGLRYFELGREIAFNNTEFDKIALNYVGYPLVLSWIFQLFGGKLIFGLLINMILMFANIILAAKSTQLITGSSKAFNYAFVFLILTAGFAATGFMLLKDVFIVNAVVLSLYSSLKIKLEGTQLKYLLLLGLAIIIISLFRFTFVWVPIIIYFVIAVKKRNVLKIAPLVALMLFLGIYFGDNFSLKKETSLESNVEFALSNQVISKRLDDGNAGFVSKLISGYDNWSLPKKIVYTPVTTGIQYLTPFNFYDLSHFSGFPYYIISRNFNIVWLAYLGPLFLFSIYGLIKGNIKNRLLFKISILGLILYILPAFIFGGAIPRYAIPFYPMLIPLMAINFAWIQENKQVLTKWRKFLFGYYSIFLILFLFFLFSKL